jgi:hypothetical protein
MSTFPNYRLEDESTGNLTETKSPMFGFVVWRNMSNTLPRKEAGLRIGSLNGSQHLPRLPALLRSPECAALKYADVRPASVT